MPLSNRTDDNDNNKNHILQLYTFLMGNLGDITKFMLSLPKLQRPKTFIRINMVDAFMMYIYDVCFFLILGLLI